MNGYDIPRVLPFDGDGDYYNISIFYRRNIISFINIYNNISSLTCRHGMAFPLGLKMGDYPPEVSCEYIE